MKKPDWWPENPYPVEIFTMLLEDYSKIIPDPNTRTAVSGMLGREFWEIASKSIWDAMCQAKEEQEEEGK